MSLPTPAAALWLGFDGAPSVAHNAMCTAEDWAVIVAGAGFGATTDDLEGRDYGALLVVDGNNRVLGTRSLDTTGGNTWITADIGVLRTPAAYPLRLIGIDTDAAGPPALESTYAGAILAEAALPDTLCVKPAAPADPTALLTTSGAMLLASQPSAGRRIDRLSGDAGTPAGSALLMGLMPMVTGGPATLSLDAIGAATGRAPSPWDVWVEGRFGALAESDSFTLVSGGADYRVSDDLLIGGMLQMDRLAAADGDVAGWSAGPYLTARLSDGLFVDLVALAGRATLDLASGDSVGATRGLVSAALLGEWRAGDWKIRPEMRASLLSQLTDAFIDLNGNAIAAVDQVDAELSFGPTIGYALLDTEAVRMDVALKLDGVWTPDGWDARTALSLDASLAGGATIGAELRQTGIVTPGLAASLRLSAALP